MILLIATHAERRVTNGFSIGAICISSPKFLGEFQYIIHAFTHTFLPTLYKTGNAAVKLCLTTPLRIIIIFITKH